MDHINNSVRTDFTSSINKKLEDVYVILEDLNLSWEDKYSRIEDLLSQEHDNHKLLFV